MKLNNLNIVQLHELLMNKKITPLQLVEECLLLIKSDKNNAFEYVLEKESIEIAKALVEPEPDNLLWGIPFVAKDNFSTKGVPTCASSNILKGYVPLFDATVIKKLKDKHAILVAKATLDELAMGGSGATGHLGKTFNPYDRKHEIMIGGSSCGSAVAVSAPIVPFSIGSDTGDSIRKPASYSGLVGFKPTWGRISRFGLFPFAPSLDHVGYFTRNVDDAAILLNALAGRDENDSTSSNLPCKDYSKNINGSIKGYRIAVIKEIVDSIKDKIILDAFLNLTKQLSKDGVIIDFVSFPRELLETIYPTYIVISCAEATSNNANLDGIKFGPYYQANTYQDEMMQARTNGFSELIKRRFVIGSFSLMRENQDVLFLRAQKNRRLIVNTLNDLMKDYDSLLLPGAPTVAPYFEGSSDKLSDEYLIADNHLVLGNFAGLPSITIPIGLENKLPFSANIMGHAFEEDKVFQIAKSLENITKLANLNAEEVLK